jgi:transposase
MKLHQGRIDSLLALIGEGMTIDSACYAVGISRKTYYLWRDQGKKDLESGTKSLQQELFEGVPQAQALNELAHLRIIMAAGKKNWKACAWYLERTRPERYGRRKPLPWNKAEGFERDGLVIIG